MALEIPRLRLGMTRAFWQAKLSFRAEGEESPSVFRNALTFEALIHAS
jgi:hypothetical protein